MLRESQLLVHQNMLSHKTDGHIVDIEGYDILRRDRNRNGGGVALYIKQSLNYVNRQDLALFSRRFRNFDG